MSEPRRAKTRHIVWTYIALGGYFALAGLIGGFIGAFLGMNI